MNLFLWLGSSLLAGIALLRLTGSLTIATVGLGIAFVVLAADALEPLHPGATIGFVLLLLVAAAAWLWPSRIPAALMTIGALTALLIAIKINVGGLALIAVAFAAVVTSPELRRVRPIVAVITAMFVIVPFALMAPKLGYADLVRFGVVVSAGALALALVTFPVGRRIAAEPTRSTLARRGPGGDARLRRRRSRNPGNEPGRAGRWVADPPAGHADSSLAAVPIHELGPVWAVSGLIAATIVVTRPIEPGPRLRVALALGRIVVGLGIWFALASPGLGLEPSLEPGARDRDAARVGRVLRAGRRGAGKPVPPSLAARARGPADASRIPDAGGAAPLEPGAVRDHRRCVRRRRRGRPRRRGRGSAGACASRSPCWSGSPSSGLAHGLPSTE